MNHTPQQPTLSRLLDLNNQVHDIERQMRKEPVPMQAPDPELTEGSILPGQIAAMQEEMDRGVRASLVTCWLGIPD